MSKAGKIVAVLTAISIMSGAAGVTAFAEDKTNGASVTAETSEHLYTYSELKAMLESDILKAYYSIDKNISKVKVYRPVVDILSPEAGRECRTLNEFCTMLAYLVLNTGSSGNKACIDICLYTKTNKYITPETGTILNGLFEGAEGFEVITPEYLKETDAFGSDRYIIRAENKRFNTYSENNFDSAETIKAITEDQDLRDVAVAYICASQLGALPMAHMGLYNNEEEEQPTVTLIGDVDLNGEVSLSDVVAVSQYNLNRLSYPLKNKAAFANADVNSDGVIDALDISALIEQQLGK